MAHVSDYNIIETVQDSKFVSRPENGLLAGFEKQYCGLYEYGVAGLLSPDNSNSNSANRTPTDYNYESIFGDNPPHWVGFLNYQTNNEVHFNGYLGNNNNGSRKTMLSPHIGRTNKHFINYNGGLTNLFAAGNGGQMLDPISKTLISKSVQFAIVFGSHVQIDAALGSGSSDNKAWFVVLNGQTLEYTDITSYFLSIFNLDTTEQLMSIVHTDDLYWVNSSAFSSDFTYPTVMSEDVFNEIDDLDGFEYLTQYTVDQNNYIRALNIHNVLEWDNIVYDVVGLNKNNFQSIIIDNMRFNDSILIKSDSSDTIMKKFISLYYWGVPVLGDSSSPTFIREPKIDDIDIFMSGAHLGFGERQAIIDKNENIPLVAQNTDLTYGFFHFLDSVHFSNWFSHITEPTIVYSGSSTHQKIIDLIEERKLARKPHKHRIKTKNDKLTVLQQTITTDQNGDPTCSLIYHTDGLKYKKLFPDVDKSIDIDYRSLVYSGEIIGYPLSSTQEIIQHQNQLTSSEHQIKDMIRSLEIVGTTKKTVKTNVNTVLFISDVHSLIKEVFDVGNVSGIYLQQYVTYGSPDSLKRKMVGNSFWNTPISYIEHQLFKKEINGTISPFYEYSVYYNFSGIFNNKHGNYQFEFNNDWKLPIVSSLSLIPSYPLALYKFYLQNAVFDFRSYNSYTLSQKNIIRLDKTKSNINHQINLDLTELKQGEYVIIKTVNPYNPDQLFETEIIKTSTSSNTIDVSSFSKSTNNSLYFNHVVTNNTITETIEYTPQECVTFQSIADFNNDGRVSGQDLGQFLSHWGPVLTQESAAFDINNDGYVNASEISLLLSSWGTFEEDVLVGGEIPTNCIDGSTIESAQNVVFFDVVEEDKDSNGDIVSSSDHIILYPNQSPADNIIVE